MPTRVYLIGTFDHNWSGAILLDFEKVVDRCTLTTGIQPAPRSNLTVGLTFDKVSPYNYKSNCDTYGGSFTSPHDCRWSGCHLPSSKGQHVQMTVAIYVC